MRVTACKCSIAAIITIAFLSSAALAQQAGEIRPKTASVTVASNPVASTESSDRERVLLDRIERLERRLAELEQRSESRTALEPLPVSTDSGAEPVERVLDTTGAGDLYAAGFLFGLTSGESLADCARLGSIAAAEVISHVGPRPLVELRSLI